MLIVLEDDVCKNRQQLQICKFDVFYQDRSCIFISWQFNTPARI